MTKYIIFDNSCKECQSQNQRTSFGSQNQDCFSFMSLVDDTLDGAESTSMSLADADDSFDLADPTDSCDEPIGLPS